MVGHVQNIHLALHRVDELVLRYGLTRWRMDIYDILIDYCWGVRLIGVSIQEVDAHSLTHLYLPSSIMESEVGGLDTPVLGFGGGVTWAYMARSVSAMSCRWKQTWTQAWE